jgi:DNA-directed RNA polymerase subunit RPC12/RpoP
MSTPHSEQAIDLRCLNCGYDLRATPSLRCPECGMQWEKRVIEKRLSFARESPGKIMQSVAILAGLALVSAVVASAIAQHIIVVQWMLVTTLLATAIAGIGSAASMLLPRVPGISRPHLWLRPMIWLLAPLLLFPLIADLPVDQPSGSLTLRLVAIGLVTLGAIAGWVFHFTRMLDAAQIAASAGGRVGFRSTGPLIIAATILCGAMAVLEVLAILAMIELARY